MKKNALIPANGKGRSSWVTMTVGVIVIVLLMVWVRALVGSAGAYRQGEESLERNRMTEAIVYFDRAVHWYAPLNPWAASSAERLWGLSESAESAGDYRLALKALNSLRSGYLAAQGLFSPGRDWIRRCEDRIDRISAVAHGTPDSSKPPRTEDARSRRSPAPSLYWTLLLEFGLLGWIGTVIWLILGHGVKKRTTANRLKWGMLLAFFFAIWIVGMIKA